MWPLAKVSVEQWVGILGGLGVFLTGLGAVLGKKVFQRKLNGKVQLIDELQETLLSERQTRADEVMRERLETDRQRKRNDELVARLQESHDRLWDLQKYAETILAENTKLKMRRSSAKERST